MSPSRLLLLFLVGLGLLCFAAGIQSMNVLDHWFHAATISKLVAEIAKVVSLLALAVVAGTKVYSLAAHVHSTSTHNQSQAD